MTVVIFGGKNQSWYEKTTSLMFPVESTKWDGLFYSTSLFSKDLHPVESMLANIGLITA